MKMILFLFLFLSVSAQAGEPVSGLPIIDAHLHTDFRGGPATSSGILRTQQELLKQMREAGAIAAIAHTENNGAWNGDDLRDQNIFHTYGIRVPYDLNEVESALVSGRYVGIKIYLGYQHFYPSDDVYVPLYRLAQKYNLPVVFHTGDTLSRTAKLKYAHPLGVDEVAVDFPEVVFVIAHMGNPWVRDAAVVVSKNTNVYADSSGLLVGDLKNVSPKTLQRLAVEPLEFFWDWVGDPSKLMFGTDWPVLSIPQWVDFHRQVIPRQNWDQVFCLNALRVFRLKERKILTSEAMQAIDRTK